MTERRKRIRIKHDAAVVITRYNGNNLQAHAMNFSAEGIALRVNSPLHSGEIVKLKFKLGDDKVYEVAAEVAYAVAVTSPSPAHQIGLQFKDVEQAVTSEFEEFIYSKAQAVAPQPLTKTLLGFLKN